MSSKSNSNFEVFVRISNECMFKLEPETHWNVELVY